MFVPFAGRVSLALRIYEKLYGKTRVIDEKNDWNNHDRPRDRVDRGMGGEPRAIPPEATIAIFQIRGTRVVRLSAIATMVERR